MLFFRTSRRELNRACTGSRQGYLDPHHLYCNARVWNCSVPDSWVRWQWNYGGFNQDGQRNQLYDWVWQIWTWKPLPRPSPWHYRQYRRARLSIRGYRVNRYSPAQPRRPWIYHGQGYQALHCWWHNFSTHRRSYATVHYSASTEPWAARQQRPSPSPWCSPHEWPLPQQPQSAILWLLEQSEPPCPKPARRQREWWVQQLQPESIIPLVISYYLCAWPVLKAAIVCSNNFYKILVTKKYILFIIIWYFIWVKIPKQSYRSILSAIRIFPNQIILTL